MKIKVIVTLKNGVLDPQGKAIQQTLNGMSFSNVKEVRQGKYFDIEVDENNEIKAKSKVEEKSNALKEATSKEDYESMKKLLEELQQELYAVGSSVYQQPGNQPPSPGAAGGPDQSDSNEKGGDDVIDADFTETKD